MAGTDKPRSGWKRVTLRSVVLLAALAAVKVYLSTTEATEAPTGPDSAIFDRARAIVAMPPGERDALINEAALDLEVAIARLSGLEQALGGPDATGLALARGWAAIANDVAALRGVRFRPVLVQDTGGPEIGSGLFGGYMVAGVGADAGVVGTNDLSPGQRPQRYEGGEGVVQVGLTGSVEKVEISSNVAHTDSEGVTNKVSTRAVVLPCPDTHGRFEASATIDVTSTAGAVGQRGTLDVTIRGQVNDDAEAPPELWDIVFRMQWSKFGGGRGEFVDVSGGRRPSVNRTGGAATEELAASAYLTGWMTSLMTASALVKAAERGWQSGRCVTLPQQVSPGPAGLEPGATSTVSAAPRSKIDGGPVGGTVTATLTSGAASVRPTGTKVRADATFTYAAPTEENKSGTVALEARSKRGIGKASIDFDTARGFQARGVLGEATITGSIADLGKTFQLQMAFPGGTGTATFTPTDSRRGRVSLRAAGSGAKGTGTGRYTVTENSNGSFTLSGQTSQCVDVSGACNTLQLNVTITPIQPERRAPA